MGGLLRLVPVGVGVLFLGGYWIASRFHFPSKASKSEASQPIQHADGNPGMPLA